MHLKGMSIVFVVAAVTLTGCGFRLPFAMGPERTPHEIRAQQGESGMYGLNVPDAPANAKGQAPAAPNRAKAYEVSPELIGQPPSRQAAARPGPTGPGAIPGDAPPAARYGDLVFLSGQLPVDSRGNPVATGIEQQAKAVMENMRSVLEANRLTMANLVSITVYLQDLNDVRAFDAVYASYFKGPQPARSVVEVSRLPRNARVEVSAVAGR
jgi:2-iminobutanoate/2-iminopropanoate deaminase